MAHLRVLTGASPPPAYAVSDRGLSIGRVGGGCDVSLDSDGRISRKHARIEYSIAGWQLQDLQSRNGLYLNGRRLGPGDRAPLPDGGVIRIGNTLLIFRDAPVALDDGHTWPAFPGVSPGAVAVRRRIRALGASSGHVLILGETGTGKERVAKAIAEHRPSQPYVALNSAQLRSELARSELFGHVRGAFTGALGDKRGLVELAGDGTLLLDEIGDLPLDVQGELLRYLEDGSYRLLGSNELRHSGARVVAATNVDLDEAVSQGRFRRDLLARLRAANTPLELPPLCERREDILGWTQIFFQQHSQDPGPGPWSAGALECLLLYPWDDNLRYLLSVVGHAVSEGSGAPYSTAHLPEPLRDHRIKLRRHGVAVADDSTPPQPPAPSPAPPPAPPPMRPPRPRTSDPSDEEVRAALRTTGGNARQAAPLLDIDRRRLYRLFEQYGIDPEAYRNKK